MILIFGGAYQGKTAFARETFGEDADIRGGLEQFTWECCAEDPGRRREAAEEMRRTKAEWQDQILIITDVSQGIVPTDERTRAFREMNGRLMLYLASEAEEVYRVFCGIGKRIK